MIFKVQSVDLREIDLNDITYHITTKDDYDDLICSIKNVGLINLPALVFVDGRYRIVCGFRRIKAFFKMGCTTIEAKVVADDPAAIDFAKLAITDNAAQRTLNLLEVSRALNLLYDSLDEKEQLSQQALALGLPENISAIHKIMKVSHLSQSIQEGVMNGIISLPIAIELDKLNSEAGSCLANLFQELGISLGKQREIISMVKEISIRDSVDILNLLNEVPIQNVLNNCELDRNQKARHLRTYLKKKRFPTIERMEKSFQHYIKSLSLEKDVKLIPPKHFEGDVYTIQLNFKNLNQLKVNMASVEKIAQHPDTKTFME